jgi:Arc/MetJ family transcription regulator
LSRTVVDLDDEALSLVSEELGTKTKVATVNAALRRVANPQAAVRMLELLDQTGTDLSDENLRGAWRTAGAAERPACRQVRAVSRASMD